MSANATAAAPTGRKKIAQGKERGDAALGHDSPNTSRPEGAKERRPLPKGWRWAQMSEVCTRVQDGTHFSPKEQTRTGDFKYITAKNIKHWGLDLTELTYVPEHVHREIYKRCNVEKGDVLYIKDGVTTGIATVNTLDEEFSLLSSVALLKPQREVLDSLFLKYYLNSPEGFRNMTGQMTGTAIKRLILQKIKAALVPVAPIPEQRRIVAEIEKQFTRLEAGVAALRRVQANLKRYRAAVLKAACEGRLVPTEAELTAKNAKNTKKKPASVSALSAFSAVKNPGFETGAELLARILTERRQNWQGRGKYEEPAAADTANLQPLPEGWTWATADQLTDENRSITYGVIKLGAPVPDGVHVLRSSDVRHLRLDLEDVKRISPDIAGEYRRTFLKGGEVLITVRGTLGGVVVAPTECAGYNISREVAMLAMVEPAVAKIAAIFIGSSPLQRWLLQRAKGIAYTGINIETLKELPIPLPPLAEQTRIVAEVERRLSVVEELESVVTANLQRAARLRQSILQKAFTGQL